MSSQSCRYDFFSAARETFRHCSASQTNFISTIEVWAYSSCSRDLGTVELLQNESQNCRLNKSICTCLKLLNSTVIVLYL